jgi:hypothetical protein
VSLSTVRSVSSFQDSRFTRVDGEQAGTSPDIS